MQSFTCLVFLFMFKLTLSENENLDPLSDAFIDLINRKGRWKAGRNFHPDTPMKYFKQLLKAQINDFSDNLLIVQHDEELIKNLPESFDPRDKWPNCPSLNEIRDQGQCGSCWAFATVAAMTDRVCTYSNGTKNFYFSAEDLVTCNKYSNDCDGGDLIKAWSTWIEDGIVSGGNYNSHQGCKPYSISTCRHHSTKYQDYTPTPECYRSCIERNNMTYEEDKRHGKLMYSIVGEDNIKAELFKNGPIAAAFEVYDDFIIYKKGVYQHLHGERLGSHAVKIVGWGVEDSKKYWLIANSWNTGFGEEGFFKILRGSNECGIESYVSAGEPLLEEY